MEVRERRPQQENVADDVTKQLQLQQRDLEGSFNLAQRVLSEVEQQLHQLTQMKNQLHQGIAEKGDSLSIDIECLALSSAHSDPKRLDDASLRTEGNWTRAFLQLIKQAAVARYNSQQVRARGATASSHRRDVDMSARKRVIAALEGKLTQTRIHRNRIEDRLIEASKEITEAQRAREEVYNALGEKQMPYQIARGRIRVRDRKPTSEKVCDAPDRSLEQELGGLSRTIGSLKDRNGQLADKLELLERMRSELENDCNDKNKAIHLDTFCLRLQHQNAPDNRNPSVSTPKKYKSTASRANRSRGGSRPGSVRPGSAAPSSRGSKYVPNELNHALRSVPALRGHTAPKPSASGFQPWTSGMAIARTPSSPSTSRGKSGSRTARHVGNVW